MEGAGDEAAQASLIEREEAREDLKEAVAVLEANWELAWKFLGDQA